MEIPEISSIEMNINKYNNMSENKLIINAIPKNMAINTSDYKTFTDEVNDILRKEKITPINREELLYLCQNQIFSGKIIPLPKPPTKEDLVKYFTNLSGELMPPKEEL